jgi:hypothetical protein
MKRNNFDLMDAWIVLVAAGVVRYQKLRGIDTSKSNRRRIS